MYLKCTKMHHFVINVIKTTSHLSRCRIFSSISTRKRLAAGLRPDPLVELERSPDLLAAEKGPTSKGRGWKGRVGEGRGKEGKRRGDG